MKKALVACVLAATLVASTNANAGLMAYLGLKNKAGAEVKGSIVQKGREGKIGVLAVEHEIKTPPGGRKQHGVFTITKEVDKSSPLLYAAVATSDTFAEANFDFWTPQISGAVGGGAEKLYYTVKLKNARIAEIKFKMANVKTPELARFAEYEEVSFTYDAIEWTFVDGAIKATDSGK